MKVFVFLFSPCLVFLQKLILPGFLLLFEGYHENLHKISDPLVPLTPLGMVWSPSYGPSKGWVESRGWVESQRWVESRGWVESQSWVESRG